MSEAVSVSRELPASPERVFELIADLPAMGRWSPENTGGRWLAGATGPAVGARFKGTNSSGKKTWSTVAKVVECDPGRAFAIEVTAPIFPVARWSYRIEPTLSGCSVTESWLDRRIEWTKPLGKFVSGVATRDADFARANMEHTLEELAKALQA